MTRNLIPWDYDTEEDEFLAIRPEEVRESLDVMRGLMVGMVLAGAAWTAFTISALFVWTVVTQ